MSEPLLVSPYRGQVWESRGLPGHFVIVLAVLPDTRIKIAPVQVDSAGIPHRNVDRHGRPRLTTTASLARAYQPHTPPSNTAA